MGGEGNCFIGERTGFVRLRVKPSLARADALVSMQAEDMEYEIASTWTDTQQSGNTLRVRAVYEIYTDIAATRDALTEEVY